MSKRQMEKLTPAASKARYPTLTELRRDSGLLKSGLAAVVLASGLAGCGSKDDVSLSGKVDGSYFAQDVRWPDLGGALSDALAPDGGTLLDVIPDLPPDSRIDQRNDSADTLAPDTGAPDRVMIIDGVPFIPYLDGGVDLARGTSDSAQDQAPGQGAGDARQDSDTLDGQPGEAGSGASPDSDLNLK